MRLKKILSLLLAMTMLFSCIGITAMAEETQTTVTTAEELLEALGKDGDVTEIVLGGDIDLSDLADDEENYVAEVNGVGYTDIQKAIVAAAPSGTVELVSDVTVEEWNMIAEKLNISDGSIITLPINGMTIDGNGFTLTVNSIESADNGGALFHDAENLNVKDLTIKFAEGYNGAIGLKNGTISNVTFDGAKRGVFVCDGGNVTVTGCTFKTIAYAIFFEEDRDGLVVENNTFDVADGGYAITMRGGVDFIDNTVVNGRVNLADSASGTVSGNNFGDNRFKVYNAATATIEKNVINNLVFANQDEVKATFGENTLSESAEEALEAAGVTVATPSAVATVNGVGYTDFADAIAAAQAMTGDVTVEIYDKVTFNNHINGSYDSIKFVGKDADAEIYMEIDGYVEASNKNVSFDDLTLSKSGGPFVNNAGFMNLAFGIFAADEVSYTNCTFANGAYASYGKNTFTNCTFYRSHDRYGFWAYGSDNIVIDGCIFDDFRGIKMYDEGHAGTTAITVKNTDFTAVNNKPAIVLTYAKSVTLENNKYSSTGVFELDLDGNPNGTPVTSDVAPTCINDNGACGVLVDGKIYTTAAQAKEVAVAGNKVTLLHNSAEIVEFVEGVILDKNGFEAAGITVAGASLSGSGTAEDPYKIGTSEELFLFASKVNDGTFKSVYAELTADIDLEQEDWTSIGTSSNPFTGTFDGKGFTISNVWSYERGLFGYTSIGNYVDGPLSGRATIKNLTINGVEVYNQSTSAVGAVVGQAGQNTELSDVTVTGYIQVWGYGYVGGVVGQGYVQIDNCHVIGVNNEDGDISVINAAYWAVGGIVGHAGSEGGTSITNCSVENVELYSAYYGAGSIAGVGTSGKIENVSAKDVVINAQSAPDANGYLVGCNYDKITGDSTATNVKLFVNDEEYVGADMVAKVGDTAYISLEEAFKAATDGCTIEILSDVVIDYKWDCRDYATNGSHSQFKETVTINGNGHTLKFTGTVNDNNWNTIFRFEENATVNDLTIDISEATGTQRVITAKKSLDVDNLTIKGSAKYGIIFGEGANATDLAAAEITVTNSDLCGTRRAISDNESGKDVKSVTITGNKLNANAYASAFESIIFSNNTATGEVDLRSYTANNTLNVTATGNTLNTEKKNYIEAGGTINAQPEFYIPVDAVAEVNGVGYETLQEALDAATAGTGNITVEILEDIDLTNVDWNPVTVSGPGYPVVTVNGNNKTITGLNDMLFAGTWAGKSGLIINDLTIKDSNIVNDKDDAKRTVGVGAFVGYPQASATITLNNCHLVNSTVEGGHWTGGLIGMAGGYNGNDGPVFMNLTITGCSVTDSTITGKGSAGGIIGHGSCAAWTNVVIEDTTVSGNTITSTGTDTNKAGAVMGTIGAAGQSTTVNGVTKTGGASVSATVSGNIVTSNGTTITTIYGRQGTETGMLYVTGGTYDNYPIEENVTYAQPKEGYKIVQNDDGTYGVKKLFEFYGVSVVLGNSLELKFYIESAQFDGTDYSVKIVHSAETGDKEKTVDFNQWETSGIYKTFSYSGIAAKQMTDDVSVVIYDKNGNPVSVELVTSLEKYALGHLANYEAKENKTQSDINWMTAMIDMLNYGSAAQLNFEYREEDLANADAGKYQGYASKNVDLKQDLVSSGNAAYATSVTFADKIVFNAYFENVTENMYAKVEFTDHYGNNKDHEIPYDNFVPNGKYHMVVVDKLVIADAAQNVKVTLCDKAGTVYGEISESVNGYLCRASEAYPDRKIYPAMARFSASAKKTLEKK